MSEKKPNQPDFQQINPDDYIHFDEEFDKKGSGGGGGGKGKKTLKALKKEQQALSREKRRAQVEISLIKVLRGFPPIDKPGQEEKILDRYLEWINSNLKELAPPDPSELEILFSKSGGPGGQNINKRETRVALVHPVTYLGAESDQTRSQLQNRKLALDMLQQRLQAHLDDWKEYLSPDGTVDLDVVRSLWEKAR